MKKRSLVITLVEALALTLVLVYALGNWSRSAMSATELRVCPSECTYSSVQAAVDAASDGDVIKVAAGTYTDISVRPRNDVTTTGVVTQVVYISKTVTIQGGFTTTNWTTPDPQANLTTLDAQKQGRVIYITGNIQPVVEGLRIAGGDAKGLGGVPWGWDTGGGVYVITATAVISNNCLFSNTVSGLFSLGGGMALWSSSASVSGNAFEFNSAGWGGGGLYQARAHPALNRNVIANSSAKYGGGAFLALGNGTFSGNVVRSNNAESGGGIVLEGSSHTLINNVIADNHVSSAGGGLWVYGAAPQLLHNTIARNSGGDGSGVYVTFLESPEAQGTVISLTNTILVSQSVGISVTGGNMVTVNGILWYGTVVTVSQSTTATVAVLNQLTGDPAFAADGYHLTEHAAAIDMGINTGTSVDIDGELRPAGTNYDLGADELWYRSLLPTVVRQNQP